MTNEILVQYCNLQQEIVELQKRKAKLEKQFEELLDGSTVSDMVTGGAGGIQHFKIDGFPIVNYERTKNALAANIQKIEERSISLLELQNKVEEYICSIEDSRMRRIIQMRFLDKMTWAQIADKMGKNDTEDSVKKSFYRFLEKN